MGFTSTACTDFLLKTKENSVEEEAKIEGKINGKNILEYLMNSLKGGNRSRDC